SVWKRLQRVGKRASKYQFTTSYRELSIECVKKWQPNKICIVWMRRNRRKCSELHTWEPTLDNPYMGIVSWPVPENVEITVTLFKSSKTNVYEDKEWIFTIEDHDKKGRRKQLATACMNMKDYAGTVPLQKDVDLKLKPVSKKILSGRLQLTVSSMLIREGNATDDDMQSMASLMSMDKLGDVGNMDDIDEDDENVPDDDDVVAQ
ncbi:hypothetical protein HELRODRAFT_150593, partial [Helobdella robusta]|uniref:C2 NT-type domain-containing protein n=1 Tax=Helobdella robusta TaxID=6412 RepID=T1EKG2_HELRO